MSKGKRRVSHIPRSIKWLQRQGFPTVALVERREPVSVKQEDGTWRRDGTRTKTHDLFGIADLMALGKQTAVLLQVCGMSQFYSHRKKMEEARLDMPDGIQIPAVAWCLENGLQVVLIGWEQVLTPVKRCVCIKEATLLGLEADGKEDCPKCKGRAYTGGRPRYHPRAWQWYEHDSPGWIEEIGCPSSPPRIARAPESDPSDSPDASESTANSRT